MTQLQLCKWAINKNILFKRWKLMGRGAKLPRVKLFGRGSHRGCHSRFRRCREESALRRARAQSWMLTSNEPPHSTAAIPMLIARRSYAMLPRPLLFFHVLTFLCSIANLCLNLIRTEYRIGASLRFYRHWDYDNLHSTPINSCLVRRKTIYLSMSFWWQIVQSTNYYLSKV